MIRLFCGHEPRESVGFHVFVHSVIERASVPVSIIPLASMGLPTGSNSFTMSRFLAPWLCGFKGRAIFADASDMLMLADVAELDRLFDERFALQCVQHPTYSTRHPMKYRGTTMESSNVNYSRKNWASLMLINCEHAIWKSCDPAYLSKADSLRVLQMPALMPRRDIGDLPAAWNVLIDEGQDDRGAKILHWTAGIPAFEQYKDAPRYADWCMARSKMIEAAAGV